MRRSSSVRQAKSTRQVCVEDIESTIKSDYGIDIELDPEFFESIKHQKFSNALMSTEMELLKKNILDLDTIGRARNGRVYHHGVINTKSNRLVIIQIDTTETKLKIFSNEALECDCLLNEVTILSSKKDLELTIKIYKEVFRFISLDKFELKAIITLIRGGYVNANERIRMNGVLGVLINEEIVKHKVRIECSLLLWRDHSSDVWNGLYIPKISCKFSNAEYLEVYDEISKFTHTFWECASREPNHPPLIEWVELLRKMKCSSLALNAENHIDLEGCSKFSDYVNLIFNEICMLEKTLTKDQLNIVHRLEVLVGLLNTKLSFDLSRQTESQEVQTFEEANEAPLEGEEPPQRSKETPVAIKQPNIIHSPKFFENLNTKFINIYLFESDVHMFKKNDLLEIETLLKNQIVFDECLKEQWKCINYIAEVFDLLYKLIDFKMFYNDLIEMVEMGGVFISNLETNEEIREMINSCLSSRSVNKFSFLKYSANKMFKGKEILMEFKNLQKYLNIFGNCLFSTITYDALNDSYSEISEKLQVFLNLNDRNHSLFKACEGYMSHKENTFDDTISKIKQLTDKYINMMEGFKQKMAFGDRNEYFTQVNITISEYINLCQETIDEWI